jgi:hypothetical protein
MGRLPNARQDWNDLQRCRRLLSSKDTKIAALPPNSTRRDENGKLAETDDFISNRLHGNYFVYRWFHGPLEPSFERPYAGKFECQKFDFQ